MNESNRSFLKRLRHFFRGPRGFTGIQGPQGVQGREGKSAFELWQELPGNEDKTLNDFFEYLSGLRKDI